MAIVKENCSGCMEAFRLDTETGTVTMTVPSNGKRGSLHVPTHQVTTMAVLDRGNDLLLWDCPFPGCGYAESVYADDETRAALP